MAKKTVTEPLPPIVVGVFEDFLKRLSEDSSIGEAVIDRLRTALLEQEDFSADSLRTAVLSEETLP